MLFNHFIKVFAFFVGLIPHWTVVVDIETTSKNPEDTEILQISLVSGSGRVLFNKYIKPDFETVWEGAQKVNHISPKRVRYCRHFSEYVPLVNAYLRHTKRLVGFNLERFDVPILRRYGIHTGAILVDIMKDDAKKRAKIGEREAKWRKLGVVARYYGYFFNAHDSVEDCIAIQHINILMHPGINTILYFFRKGVRCLLGVLLISAFYQNGLQLPDIDEQSKAAIVFLICALWSYVYGPFSSLISALIGMTLASASNFEIIQTVLLSFVLGIMYNFAKPSKPLVIRIISAGLVTIVCGGIVLALVPRLLYYYYPIQLLDMETIVYYIIILLCGIPIYFVTYYVLPRIL